MRNGYALGQNGPLVRSEPETRMPAAPTAKEIPYDYVATFTLKGKRGERTPEVINISVEGAFVAAAIGYSFIPRPLPQLPEIEATVTGADRVRVNLSNLIASEIAGGLANTPLYTSNVAELERMLVPVIQPLVEPRMLMQCLLVRLCGIDFLYSIIDSATGREMQNLPIHNIAGLGEPTGDRPFRPLAKPMLFMPRSTIRIEVEEVSEGPIYEQARLFIVLHGYKILGYGTGLP